MFTGLVETMGEIARVIPSASGQSLQLLVRVLGDEPFAVQWGDSVAVNGCCLTVTRPEGGTSGGGQMVFDVSSETLARTNFKTLQTGMKVNLERSLRVGDRLGGHMVYGHVDTTVSLQSFAPSADGAELKVLIPKEYARYCVAKGSATLDGVSLTINMVKDTPEGSILSFMIIPTTLQKTNLGASGGGRAFNFEVDVLAKFVERIAQFPR